MSRKRLPDERESLTHHFTIYTSDSKQVDGYLIVGLYPDGSPGELFVKIGKAGDTTAAIDQWAIACSMAIQHGAPVYDLMRKFVGAHFEPFGRLKHDGAEPDKSSAWCTSVVDYIAKFMIKRFPPPPDQVAPVLDEPVKA